MGSARTRARPHQLTGGRLLLILLCCVLMVGCGREPEGTVVGLVTGVDGDLAGVDGFTLLTDDGEISLTVGDSTRFLFPQPHLREHLRSGEPVRVEYASVDGLLHALTVDDG